MLILSNCLADKPDEGTVKVAFNLIKRIKQRTDSTIITYDRKSELSDVHLNLNKFMLSAELRRLIRAEKQKVLYLPFPAKFFSTAVRVFIVSLYCADKLSVIITQQSHVSFISKLLLRLSGAEFIVLSKSSEEIYRNIIRIPPRRIHYLKTGVDTDRFCPVSEETARDLKLKYGFDPDRKLILHCGHLNYGRNVDKLLLLPKDYQVLLVASTLTKNEQDHELRSKLLAAGNISIIDDYVPDINELYQMSDAYFFPVESVGRCIDVPLSCLEAAACGTPVVTTSFGEMSCFVGESGFYFIESFDPDHLSQLIDSAIRSSDSNPRGAVLAYDWDKSISYFSDN